MAPPHRGLSKGINQGLSKGINKKHVVTKRQLPPRPSDRKGEMSKRASFVKSLIREVAGFAPYEKRITELLKSGKEKHALKVAKRKLGTHKRAKKKINEMANVFRKKSLCCFQMAVIFFNEFQSMFLNFIRFHLLLQEIWSLSHNKDPPPPPPPPGDLQGWADLPVELLHSVISLMGSFVELLAFSGTCRSWRTVFSSYPTKPALCGGLPPLLVRPMDDWYDPNYRGHDGFGLRKCKVIDVVNQKNAALWCQIPDFADGDLFFAGSSFGQLISIHGQDCHMLDVFTGATIRAPPLQSEVKKHCRGTCGVLTAPVTSPESRLILCVSFTMFGGYSLLAWHVGSRSWSEAIKCPRIDQVIQFNGQLIARDSDYKLYVLSVVPELRLDQIISESDDAVPTPFASPWLVACGDMLVMVERHMNDNLKHQFNAYKARQVSSSG
ncbi:unnamed protein product [Urochloa decumbens]|uniref:60S ribosomal protein L36 n=1 Tax=Urochloa decumbens TaxID=240449 RepID=A0ABC9BJX4_9POAL